MRLITGTNVLLDSLVESLNCNQLAELSRGRRYRVTAEVPESISFLRDTFYPDGAFQCHIGRESVCPVDEVGLEVIDRVFDEDAFEDLVKTARAKATSENEYAPTRYAALQKYEIPGAEIF